MKVAFKCLTDTLHYVEVDKIIPPTSKFPYWTIYFSPPRDDQCAFVSMYQTISVAMEGGEAQDGTVRED